MINAGDGSHEHPTQALLDALTIRRRMGRLSGLKVAICGDILHSRVARSNIHLLNIMGARVRVVAPRTLLPRAVERLGVEVFHDMSEGLQGCDIVMMLRLQTERMHGNYIPSIREYFHFFGLTYEKLQQASAQALIMHPGPMNRGVEIDSVVADDFGRSVIREQVEMGVAVRMACLELLASPPGRRRAPQHLSERGQRRQSAISAGTVSGRNERAESRVAYLHARLLDPASGLDLVGGLLTEGERIADFGPHLTVDAIPEGAEVVECDGHCLAPGLVDIRVQLREPAKSTRARVRRPSGDGGRHHVHGLPAQHQPGDRRHVGGRVRRPARPPARPDQGLSLRRRHPRPAGRGTGRDGHAQRGGRGGVHRWGEGGGERQGDASGAQLRADIRPADRRARRGAEPGGRGR